MTFFFSGRVFCWLSYFFFLEADENERRDREGKHSFLDTVCIVLYFIVKAIACVKIARATVNLFKISRFDCNNLKSNDYSI